MTLHTPKEEFDDLTMDYYGKKLRLLQPIENAVEDQEAYTSLNTIEADGSITSLSQFPFMKNSLDIDKVIDFLMQIDDWPVPVYRPGRNQFNEKKFVFSIIGQRNEGRSLTDRQIAGLIRVAKNHGMNVEEL
jgi:hypothetical protein